MKAFLSHSSKDKSLVAKVQQILENGNSWYDAIDITNGERIPDKINEGLAHSSHFILFWSEASKNSNWVRAEINAAFVRAMSDSCKLMIFCLDDAELPPLLLPYKYDNINPSNIEEASSRICAIIMSAKSTTSERSKFVNRMGEISTIEKALNIGVRLIVITGILGIGKHFLVKKANDWFFNNRSILTFDLSNISALPEL